MGPGMSARPRAVDNHDLRLLPNVNVSVSIVTAEHDNVLTLQRDAIRLDDTQPYVYQIVDNHLKRQRVHFIAESHARRDLQRP